MPESTDHKWVKPGAGGWEWDAGHFPGALTPLYQQLLFPSSAAGWEVVFRRLGLPLRTLEWRSVEGKCYRRLIPLIAPNREPMPLPGSLVWVVMRVVPEMRRRNRQAQRAFEERFWRQELHRWHDELRPEYAKRNAALQQEDLGSLDDAALADHLQRAFDHAFDACRLHFELHGSDLAPLGDLLAHGEQWGLPESDVVGVLAGASPATTAAADALQELVEALDGQIPASLDEVRDAGPAAAAALDRYLDEYGWRLVSSYDLDGQTLGELPAVILSSIRAAAEPRHPTGAESVTARLRSQVPDTQRDLFDQLVAEARLALGLRDDNAPLTIQLPTGLLRRAVLEVGRRLAERDRLEDPGHGLELDLEELRTMLLTGDGPDARDVAARARRRAELAGVTPPALLGRPDPEPPVSALPAPMRRSVRVMQAVVRYIDAEKAGAPLTGVGIGTAPYTGRARLVDHTRADAFATMEPGDVLVAPYTTPSYNTLIFIAGAIVCEAGGPLSHAAVMARELGIPAVVGAAGAMTMLRDGETVEVDPVAGTVRGEGALDRGRQQGLHARNP